MSTQSATRLTTAQAAEPRAYPAISLVHLQRMSDDIGLFEHAKFTCPRIEHGYCVDDVARGLIVTSREVRLAQERETAHARTARHLMRVYLDFIAEAQAHDGRMRNRRSATGRWTDTPSVEDAWGRALWGLGSAVAQGSALAGEALRLFERSAHLRSDFSRSMTFAALGAAEVLRVIPEHPGALSLLRDAIACIGMPGENPRWPWPEERLTYANASVAEVVIAGGEFLHEPPLVVRGLTMLDWLVRVQLNRGHLSVIPVGGRRPGEPRPSFDQQPIEVSALADAATRAHGLTRDPYWARFVHTCAAWFDGKNDVGIPMADHSSGAGFDGLERAGRNENCGAESTLAMLSTFQHAHRLAAVTP